MPTKSRSLLKIDTVHTPVKLSKCFFRFSSDALTKPAFRSGLAPQVEDARLAAKDAPNLSGCEVSLTKLHKEGNTECLRLGHSRPSCSKPLAFWRATLLLGQRIRCRSRNALESIAPKGCSSIRDYRANATQAHAVKRTEQNQTHETPCGRSGLLA